uniref:hypothetical protein n=1 Tax=Microbacterium sp. K22 TaxID=2305447 RepID=UPI00197B9188
GYEPVVVHVDRDNAIIQVDDAGTIAISEWVIGGRVIVLIALVSLFWLPYPLADTTMDVFRPASADDDQPVARAEHEQGASAPAAPARARSSRSSSASTTRPA